MEGCGYWNPTTNDRFPVSYTHLEADAPEIDGTVLFVSEQEHDAGEFVTVKIIDATEYDLMGQVVQEETE